MSITSTPSTGVTQAPSRRSQTMAWVNTTVMPTNTTANPSTNSTEPSTRRPRRRLVSTSPPRPVTYPR